MIVTENIPAYTRYHWAKSDRTNPRRIHLLDYHLADVGACMEALLQQPTIRQRLARSGGRDTLDDATAARLCVFAALHDIGKVNVGFQTRIWGNADFPSGQRRPNRGRPYGGPDAGVESKGYGNCRLVLRRPGLVVGSYRVLG